VPRRHSFFSECRGQIPTIVRGTIIAHAAALFLLAKRKNPASKKRHIQPLEGLERAFGDALREIRKEHGVSQERLALDSGLDRTYVSLLERGAQSPTIRSVVKLANVLGIMPSEIVRRMETLMGGTHRLRPLK
jgi:ribosome-binding protein aMBF1 (putative translation factor)